VSKRPATISLMVRLPVALHEWLKLAAIDEQRSLNAEVVHLLQECHNQYQHTRQVDFVWQAEDGTFYVKTVPAIVVTHDGLLPFP